MFPDLGFTRLSFLCLLLAACGGARVHGPETSQPEIPGAMVAAAQETSPEPAARIETIREDLVAREIQPGTWVITHERPLSANSLVVRSVEGDVLLVDTPWTPDATAALLRWIDAELEPTSRKAINTHYHLDALGGNEALRDAGVGAQGLVTTAELLQSRGAALRQGVIDGLDDPELAEEFASMELLPPPSLYMAPRFGMPLGPSERYELIFPGHAHSPDNLVVYFPERKLLFGGCLVKGGRSLGYLGDADLETWPDAIRQLQELDIELLVPGHGTRLDREQLENTLELLEREGE